MNDSEKKMRKKRIKNKMKRTIVFREKPIKIKGVKDAVEEEKELRQLESIIDKQAEMNEPIYTDGGSKADQIKKFNKINREYFKKYMKKYKKKDRSGSGTLSDKDVKRYKKKK